MIKYLAILTFILASCNQKENNNNLISITVSSSGGMQGYSSSEKISSDSMIYFQDIHVDELPAIDKRLANTKYKLSELVTAQDLQSFQTIKDGQTTAMFDGVDTQIIIETQKEKYTVVNGDSSKVWQKIRSSIDKIFDKEFNRQK